MSVKAILIIDDKEVNVLNFDFSYQKQADTNGRPTGKAVFNGINIAIESRKDLNLADWAIAPNEKKQLQLHIYPRFLNSKTRKFALYDCHLLHWNNNFSATGIEPLKEILNISCAGVKDSDSTKEYAAYWRETFDNDVEATVITKNEDKDVHIISCNYTDMDGNPISELYEGDEIILTVNTEDCVGKPIDINLSEFDFGFKYKGKVVKNNMLTNIKVTANAHPINLEVIEQED